MAVYPDACAELTEDGNPPAALAAASAAAAAAGR